MTSPNELRDQGFIIINANTETKSPANHLGKGIPEWQTKTYEELGRLFDADAEGFGIRCGIQQNGRFILSLDFDCCGDKTQRTQGGCSYTQEKLAEYRDRIDRYDGFYSSSTEGNMNVLVDYTDSESLRETISKITKDKLSKGGMEILLKTFQVCPPTATKCKITEKMGNPRQFLNGVPFYVIDEGEDFIVDFIQRLLKDAEKKTETVLTVSIPDSPRGVGSLSPRIDKWEDLLFNVIKNEGNLRLTYDEWFKLGCILKSNDYPLSLFLRFTNDDEIEKTTQIWNGIEKRSLSIYGLQKIGKKNNLMDYQQWLIKYRVYIPTSVLIKGENDIAKFIAPQLKGTVIYTGKVWWKNNGTIWISSTKPPLATIISAIQTTIDESLMSVTFIKNQTDDEAEKKKLSLKIETYLSYHSKVAQGGISSQIAKLLMEYCYDANFESNLDKLPYKIVYDDGIFDLRTQTFTKGIRPSDFVTQTLQYSYCKGIQKVKNEIKEAFKKICNYNDEHLEYYLSLIGYCLTGDASALQEFYAFIGQTASNGKSTALVALQNILDIYVVNTDKCAFDEGNKKIHKEIATWRGRRIIWLNEGSGKQQDTQLLKDLSDGTRIKFDRLYGTNENMDIQAKIIFVSNNSLATKIDSGIIRRYKHLQFNSKFYGDGEKEGFVEEDTKKLEFKKIAKFDDYLIENKHSLLELLFEYSHKFYLTKKLPKEPKEFNQEKDEMIVSNDKFRELFDEYFEVGAYQCWKNDFEDVMKTLKGFNLKDECKRRGYKYDSQKEMPKEENSKRRKGVYSGFRIRIAETKTVAPKTVAPVEAEIDPEAEYK
jgi:phage/plasmid-associated DNA primase